MDRNLKLTEGKITSTLVKLALPIMGTAFIQMAYSLTDTMWLGRFSTKAVAAVGTAGNLMWFGAGLILITQVGLGVSVAQSFGRGDMEAVKKYISHGFQLDIFIAILYSLILFIFNSQIIGFFNLNDIEVIKMAEEYLRIIAIGLTFHFLNPIFSTTLNSTGNSVTPFKLNALGLIINMILDPILIFGLGPIPALGSKGAAIATVAAQFIVSMAFIILGKRDNAIYSHVNLFIKPDFKYIGDMAKLGFPPFVQTAIHSSMSMVLTRIVAQFGHTPVAVYNIGSQIESISWMSAEGFSSAISAFIGQNFGAKKIDRIKEGYHKGMQILGSIGIFATILLVFGARPIFTAFTPRDPIAIEEGIKYLRILGLSQFFMTMEIGTAGAFNGIGKTLPPTLIGIIFNVLRVPLALALSSTRLGIVGIWWSISVSSIIKGIISPIIYNYVLKHRLEEL